MDIEPRNVTQKFRANYTCKLTNKQTKPLTKGHYYGIIL